VSTISTPFYSNQTIEQQLDLIHHMLQFGDELLLVSGQKGVGKSSQLQELMRRLGEGWEICYLSASESPQISQLFEQVSQSFGYDYSTTPSAELLKGFQHHLEQSEPGKTYALLIDDAEQLDESTLEAVIHLSQLQNSNGRLLRVALYGGEQLSSQPILKVVPFREVVIEPLNSKQSRDYIDFSIEQGGYPFDQPPSTALQQQIENRAGGIPAQIEAMLQQPPQGLASLRKILDWRVAAVILLLFAAIAGYLLNNGGEEGSSAPQSVNSKVNRPQQPVLRKPVTMAAMSKEVVTETTAEVVVTETAPPVKSESRLISELLKQGEPLLVDPGPSVEMDSALDLKKDKQGGEIVTVDVDSPVVEAPVQAVTEQPAESISTIASQEGGEDETPAAPVKRSYGRAWLQQQPATSFTIQLLAAERETALDELIIREGLQENLARFSFARNGRVIHVLTQGLFSDRVEAEVSLKRFSPAVKPWIRPIADIQQLFTENPPPDIDPVVTLSTHNSVKDSAWLWSQNPELITIQLVAGGNREMLEPYIKQSLRIGDTAIVESKRDSRPWFILLHGRYKNRDEARSAIGEFPQELQSEKPWVRNFASVHDELSRAN